MKKRLLISFIALLGFWQAQAQNTGDKVQVLWNGSWYPATVKESKDGQWFVHYDNFDAQWDEWVGQDRIKQAWKKGDKLHVEWKGDWFEASILEVGEGKYKVHYEGWGDEWDEWVTPNRMRK